MIEFPGAKINLGLYVTEKRKDGFHNIATIFYPVPLSLAFSDSLEILPDLSASKAPGGSTLAEHLNQPFQSQLQLSAALQAKTLPPILDKADGHSQPSIATTAAFEVQGQPIQYSQSGLPIAGDVRDNLCIKAYSLLKKDFPKLPAIRMHLHKNIPMGGGLGGGSSDGASALKMINQIGKLDLSTSQLLYYAAALGSDCPFFIDNQPAIGTGRGEILTPLQLNLKGYHLVLIHPGIHVPTSQAFAGIQPQPFQAQDALRTISSKSPEHWRSVLENKFEPTVFSRFPAIQEVKEALYAKGAVYASMTGTGSTVYGIFTKPLECTTFNLPAHYRYFAAIL